MTENYVTSNLLLDLDARFGDGNSPGTVDTPSTWTDLSGNGNDGTLLGGTSWNGTGSAGDPYRLSFDGVDGKVDLGSAVNGSTRLFDSWVKATDTSSSNAVIIGNGGDSGLGFALREPC